MRYKTEAGSKQLGVEVTSHCPLLRERKEAAAGEKGARAQGSHLRHTVTHAHQVPVRDAARALGWGREGRCCRRAAVHIGCRGVGPRRALRTETKPN